MILIMFNESEFLQIKAPLLLDPFSDSLDFFYDDYRERKKSISINRISLTINALS